MHNQGDGRPDPDVLLARLKGTAERAQRARLKVFLGYAPGVGKTYAMLAAAQRLQAAMGGVVVGCVETHGRAETEAMLAELEVLPRRQVAHAASVFQEFDLSLALQRHPRVLLLDELAHTNAPGSRHPKRWQDALALLDAGVEVHTTVNVQHLESMGDVVARVTGVQVRETVPDAVLDRADEVVLIDLPPDELLSRLREGKVYMHDQAARAEKNYFRRGNLMALRELALRRTADRVDADVLTYRHEHGIAATWAASERILACVGPSPSSAQIIRSARRLAAGLRSPWVAVYADGPGAYPAGDDDRARLDDHLRLAESLGAEVVRLAGNRSAAAILDYAREHNVTRIVIGKPRHPRWRDLVRGSLVGDLVRGSGDIEMHIVSGVADHCPVPQRPKPKPPTEWAALFGPVALTGLATGAILLVRDYLSLPDAAMLYLLLITLVAARWGRWPAMLTSAMSVAAYDYFLVPPFNSFAVESLQHLLTFGTMFGIGLTVSGLVARLRRQEIAAVRREQRLASLHSLGRELEPVLTAAAAARIAADHASGAFGGRAGVLLRDPTGQLLPAAVSPPTVGLADGEMLLARWADERGQPTGAGTDTRPDADVACAPLCVGTQRLGVLLVGPVTPASFSREQAEHLEAFARQVSVTIERARLGDEAKAAALRARTEEVRSSLLSAVSHDLRTPLAAITGAGTALRDEDGRMDATQRADLLETICSESDRMSRLVGNLLDMMRLESGGLVPTREWVPLEEVVGSALTRLENRFGQRHLAIDLPPDLPLVSIDPVLFEQVLVNLLDNALKYTPVDSPLEIAACADAAGVRLWVSDRGPGLAAGEELAVFEKFHRGRGHSAPGVGLGLPICQGIVLAHGGSIDAEARPGGGVTFRIHLPASPASPARHEEPAPGPGGRDGC